MQQLMQQTVPIATAIATRYEKLAVRFLGFVHMCCALIWLK